MKIELIKYKSLGFKTYQEYLESDWWLDKKKLVLSKTKKCEQCNSHQQLYVHHITYDTLGNEPRKDLMVVCYDCHQEIHDGEKQGDSKKTTKRGF